MARHCHLLSASTPLPLQRCGILSHFRALNKRRMGAAEADKQGLAPLSTVGPFCPQPELSYAADSVEPDGYPLVLVAARASCAVLREGCAGYLDHPFLETRH